MRTWWCRLSYSRVAKVSLGMATHRVPGVRNSAMLVVSLDPDRGWWRAAPPEANASGSDHAWGGAPRGSVLQGRSAAQRSAGGPQCQAVVRGCPSMSSSRGRVWQDHRRKSVRAEFGNQARRKQSKPARGKPCRVALHAVACSRRVLRVSARLGVLNGNP